tara:strand:+ start:358 stop:1695 length:1338 start_codon:yes stop_codon:yes gene_type:complete
VTSKRYPGNIISSTATNPTGDAANGVWNLSDVEEFKAGNKWPTLPLAPTIGTATNPETGGVIIVPFTPGELYGGTAQYTVTSNPGSLTNTGSSSPISVGGLTNETSYTFSVVAVTGAGTSAASSASNSIAPTQADRGVFMAGQTLSSPYATNTMDYINIKSTGNATDFGDLAEKRGGGGAASSSTRGLNMAGGDIFGDPGSTNYSNRIDYITIANTGNSVYFGALANSKRTQMVGLSNDTRALQTFGQKSNGQREQQIEYVTIASTGNASSFGDAGYQATDTSVGFASTTRGVFGGGTDEYGANRNDIRYVTIASTGNSTDFGDWSIGNFRSGGTSSNTRGLGMLYSGSSNGIYLVTIASTGNSGGFGNLLNPGGNTSSGRSYYMTATSNNTRAVIAEGYNNSSGGINTLSYVTISTTGDAADFGDLTVARYMTGAVSGTHGGIS